MSLVTNNLFLKIIQDRGKEKTNFALAEDQFDFRKGKGTRKWNHVSNLLEKAIDTKHSLSVLCGL